MQAGRQEEADEDFTSGNSKGTLVSLLEDLGDSIKTEFPKNEIRGDLEWFIRRLDAELVSNGADKPRLEIERNALAAEKLAGAGYRALVEETLLPLAGRANPLLESVSSRLAPIPSRLGEQAKALQIKLKIIKDQQGDPEQLSPFEAQASQQIEELSSLSETLSRAYGEAQSAQSGLRGGAAAATLLDGTGAGSAGEAGRLDNLALRGATRNAASGRKAPEGRAMDGLSRPVLEMVAARLDAAGESASKAYARMSLVADPQSGPFASAIADAKAAAEFIQKSVQDAKRRGPDAGKLASQAESKAAEGASAAQRASGAWSRVRDETLGAIDGADLSARLPFPLPSTPTLALERRPTQALYDAVNSGASPKPEVKSRPIRYPEALEKDTRSIMRLEGIDDGAFSCGSGGC